MDSTISAFLKEGPMHPTRKSHRTAAVNYSNFLEEKRQSNQNDRLKLTRRQLKALREWLPLEPNHVCPEQLAVDNYFAKYLIWTLRQIEAKKFGKPTLRARQG